MGTIIRIKDVKLEWAKLKEENRDMGKSDGSDVSNKLDLIQGQYVVDVMLTADQVEELKVAGVPHTGLQAQLFKQRNTGELFYKAKRGHFNPKFTDKGTGESGVVVGPPDVYKYDTDGETVVAWDWGVDGLIGNGTTADVKFDVWDKKITTLMGVLVTDLVPYEATVGSTGW